MTASHPGEYGRIVVRTAALDAIPELVADRGRFRANLWHGGRASLDLATLRSKPRRGHIFIRPMCGSYPPQHLSNAFNKWLRGHDVEATACQLRHWFGTNLYAATLDLRLTRTTDHP